MSVLETGITSGTVYYVVNANPVTGEFQLALTEGGVPITLVEEASGAMRSSTLFYRDPAYDAGLRAGTITYPDPTYTDNLRTGVMHHFADDGGDLAVYEAALAALPTAEVNWYDVVSASGVEDAVAVNAAQAEQYGYGIGWYNATLGFVEAFLGENPLLPEYRQGLDVAEDNYTTVAPLLADGGRQQYRRNPSSPSAGRPTKPPPPRSRPRKKRSAPIWRMAPCRPASCSRAAC